MRRYLSLWAILLVLAMVHLDWHFGRAHHHRLSLEWHYHWLTGLVTFLLLTVFSIRKWPGSPLLAVLVNGAIGLFLGQIAEPYAEVLIYKVSLATAFTPERWQVFEQFVFAGFGGVMLAMGIFLRPKAKTMIAGK